MEESQENVHYSASTNTPMFRSASGASKYQAFAAILSEKEGEDQQQQSISRGWPSEGDKAHSDRFAFDEDISFDDAQIKLTKHGEHTQDAQ